MMRSPNFYTVSVRDEAGKIRMKQVSFTSILKRFPILKTPLIRGVIHLGESMNIGFKSLDYSNSIFIGGGEEEKPAEGFMALVWGLFTVLYFLGTLAFSLFLLKALPLFVATKLSTLLPVLEENYLLFNLVDGFTKIVIFFSYILLISLMKDVRRVFQYHGAEHKSIWAYEAGLPLTVENVKKQTRFHPRCGTSFLFIVILMSILIYTVVPPFESFALMLLSRILVIPVIAALSYELLKVSAKYQGHFWVKALSSPGLFIQRLTTREPDSEQIEVAIHSLKASLEAEGGMLDSKAVL